ncbi:MAG: monothiol glutaredoxin grx5 [Peltula sp. TS41687]|nr:MAG: monothiol glutaredoxin grx5 [Peltula sp. TS41687]
MFSRTALLPSIRQTITSRPLPPLLRPPTTTTPPPLQPRLRLLQPFLSRHLSTSTRSAIDKAISSSPVVLFMKGTPETPQCGFSRATIQILGLQAVDPAKFTAFDVLEDDELRQGIKEYSDWPTIPQLYVNKSFVGGCDILVKMHQSGELATMLEGEKVLVPPPAEQEEVVGSAGEGRKEN